jgi:3-oxoacyl-[acyl-carrier-protein] synthase III
MNIKKAERDFGIGVIGTGKYLPADVITNEELERNTGIKQHEIVAKTGIISRRRAAKDEVLSDMAVKAAIDAISMAGISPLEIGLILTCTFTGDYVYPAVSCRIQEKLGAINAGAFDLMANCTGFQIGLSVASDKMKQNPQLKYSLVIGAALQTRFIDPTNKDTAIYFGDGVGAAILSQVPEGYGILSTDILSNGRAFDSVRLRGGGSSYPLNKNNIDMGLQFYDIVGVEVWKQVVQNLPKSMARAAENIGIEVGNIDFFIFHQANLRLLEFLMAKMKRPLSDTCINVEKYGNTADASQAITLCDAVNGNALKRGDLVAIAGVGAGFIFGTTILKWY